MSRHFAPRSRVRGFSLLELIAVVLILGILSVSVTFGLQESAEAARSARTRAELTDEANQAMQRIQRDLRVALPNSPRVGDYITPGSLRLEMLLIKSAGRFRRTSEMAAGTAIAGNLGAPGPSIDSIAPLTGFGTAKADVAQTDFLVINNAPATPTSAEHNAYALCGSGCGVAPPACDTSNATDRCNATQIQSVTPTGTGTRIAITDRHFAPTVLEADLSPVFYIIANPKILNNGSTVSYLCTPGARNAQGDATGQIDRLNRYTPTLINPVSLPYNSQVNRLLDNVETCLITAFVGPGQPGIVRVEFTVTRRNESVTVSQDVWVPNS